MKSLSDFHDVTFNFLRPKVTDTGTLVTLGKFNLSSEKEISLLLEIIEGRIIKDLFSTSSLQNATKTSGLKNDDVTYDVWWCHFLFAYFESFQIIYTFCVWNLQEARKSWN